MQHRDAVTLLFSYEHWSFVLLDQSFVSITQMNHRFDHVEHLNQSLVLDQIIVG